MTQPRFVNVVWNDAWADGVDDSTLEKVHEKHHPMVMETRGWLGLDDDIGVSLFSERTNDQVSYRGRTFIPRGMIISVADFPPKRKRNTKVKENHADQEQS
jgi:hypothetical protein